MWIGDSPILLGGAAGYALRQAAGFLVPMEFLRFSRKAETEADYLGLQYAYKTGYDPSAIVTFFEKLQAKEKARPGTMSKLFETHPPTSDRVAATKQNLAKVLPSRDEFVITTSEFVQVKRRLLAAENRTAPHGENRPTLRRKPHAGHEGQPDTNDEDDKGKRQEPEEDERPTLKRRNP